MHYSIDGVTNTNTAKTTTNTNTNTANTTRRWTIANTARRWCSFYATKTSEC